ncbi:MAG: hypothetical protein P4L97_05620 [Dyella sp.]|nr:hypothetical protein [Dyella sp.]
MVVQQGKYWIMFSGFGRGSEPNVEWKGYWRIYDQHPTSDVEAIEIGQCETPFENPFDAADDGKRAGVARAKQLLADGGKDRGG